MKCNITIDKKIIEEMMLDEEEIKLLEEQEKEELVESNDLDYLKNDVRIIAKNTIGNMKKIKVLQS